MQAHVYMVRCADGAYYIGSHRGDDVANRVADHNAGLHRKAWTWRRRPVELVWSDYFACVEDAIAVERQLKGWTRAKKEALIQGDWATIRVLARSATPRPSAVDRLRVRPAQDKATSDVDGAGAESCAPRPRPASS